MKVLLLVKTFHIIILAFLRYSYCQVLSVLSYFDYWFVSFSEVFANSPFFISAEEAGALEARWFLIFFVLCMTICFILNSHRSLFNRKNDDYKEISVPAGKSHEVCFDILFGIFFHVIELLWLSKLLISA